MPIAVSIGEDEMPTAVNIGEEVIPAAMDTDLEVPGGGFTWAEVHEYGESTAGPPMDEEEEKEHLSMLDVILMEMNQLGQMKSGGTSKMLIIQ